MKKVNFFVVGEPKCGTTLLYEYFKEHPDVEVPSRKEPRFFCTDLQSRGDKLHGFSYYFPIRKLKDYHALWNTDETKIKAEFSPPYLISKEAARNIYKYNTNAKILAIFREPVSFLQSMHSQLLTSGSESIKDFKKALEMEANRRKKPPLTARFPLALYYSEWIKYSKQLKRYLDYFPKSQIKVILFEDLKADNQKIMDEICGFLNIKRIKLTEKKVNVRKDVRSVKLAYFFYQSMKLRKIGQKILPLSVRRKWGELVHKITLKEAKKKSIDPKLKKELMQKYKPEMVKLNKLLHKRGLIEKDKDLIEYWGYDKV